MSDSTKNGAEPKPSQGASTEAHVARAASGQLKGFASLYEKLAPAIYTWARLRIHESSQRRIDPEDIVQEVWWRAMDSFSRYDPKSGPFRPWLFGIATNVLLESFRKSRTRSPVSAQHEKARIESLPPELAVQATSISRQASRKDGVHRLVQIIGRLDATDQAVFIHCGLEGLSAPDTSELICLGADATLKRWQRLRTKLREASVWEEFLAS